MSEQLKVILPDEQSQALKDYVYTLVTDSVASAKRDAGISQKWLRKNLACKYAGVSNGTFSEWSSKRGLPCHIIEGVTLYAVEDIDKFINHNGQSK